MYQKNTLCTLLFFNLERNKIYYLHNNNKIHNNNNNFQVLEITQDIWGPHSKVADRAKKSLCTLNLHDVILIKLENKYIGQYYLHQTPVETGNLLPPTPTMISVSILRKSSASVFSRPVCLQSAPQIHSVM